MLRALSLEEVALVSGGMMDTDGGFDGDDGDGFSQISEDFGNTLNDDAVTYNTPLADDIVVTATSDQVQEAKDSYYMAEILVNAAEYGSGIAGAAINTYGGDDTTKFVGGATGAVAAGLIADNKAAITNAVSDGIYRGMRNGSLDSISYTFSALAAQ